MPNNKKVIPFPQSGFWTFYDWVDGDGSNPIEDWVKDLSPEARDKMNSLLKNDRKTRLVKDWLSFRHKMTKTKKLANEGICELGFTADKREHRLLVKFDGKLQVVIICGCYHKGDQWTPRGALNTTLERARALSQGKARRHERKIEEDF